MLRAGAPLARSLAGIPPGRIEWLGQVSDEKLADLYRRAQALVFPSLHEGFGLPPVEAMACGTPVIVSDLPVFHETVADAGLYVDPASVTGISETMLRLLGDEGLQAAGSRRGLARAAEFTWENCARRTYRAICEAAGKNVSATR